MIDCDLVLVSPLNENFSTGIACPRLSLDFDWANCFDSTWHPCITNSFVRIPQGTAEAGSTITLGLLQNCWMAPQL